MKRSSIFLSSCLLAALMSAAAAGAADLYTAEAAGQKRAELEAVVAGLSEARLVRGRFVQEKKVAVLSKPLTSAGEFLAAGGKGVLWKTEKPFRSWTVISAAGIYRLRDGKREDDIPPDKQEIVAGFSRAFLAVFSGDMAALDQNFRVYYEPAGPSWRIGLVPRDRTVLRFVAQITVSGGPELLESLEVKEQNGDTTSIRLSGAAQPDSALEESESQAFQIR